MQRSGEGFTLVMRVFCLPIRSASAPIAIRETLLTALFSESSRVEAAWRLVYYYECELNALEVGYRRTELEYEVNQYMGMTFPAACKKAPSAFMDI
jgi:hypothetical protein